MANGYHGAVVVAKVIGRESRQKAICPEVIDGGGIQILDIDDPFSQPCRRDSPTPNERSRQREQRIDPQRPTAGPLADFVESGADRRSGSGGVSLNPWIVAKVAAQLRDVVRA